MCDLRQKKFSYWFKNLNPTTCCLHDMTTVDNDSERFQKFKGKEGLQANSNKKKTGITVLLTGKVFFVLF